MTVADDVNQTGRNFHLASIQFSTSKADVLMRLTILNNNDEVTSVEGKGSVVLPAFLFLRDVTNSAQAATTTAQPTSRPPSKTGGECRDEEPVERTSLFVAGTSKKDGAKAAASTAHRGSVADGIGSARSDKEKGGSGKRSVSEWRVLIDGR